MRYHGPVMDESSSDALFPTDLPALKWQRFPAAGFSNPVCGVIYRTDRPPCCGVPLGGISTGCIDIDVRGVYGFSSVFHPKSPRYKHSYTPRKLPTPQPILGLATRGKTWVLASRQFVDGGEIDWCTSPAIAWGKEPKVDKVTCGKIEGVEAVKQIHYWGHYPVADMIFETDAPISVGMRAWAPFIPGDTAASNIPAAVFEVHLGNDSDERTDGTIAFNFPGPDQQEARSAEFSRQFMDEGFQGMWVRSKDRVNYVLGMIGQEKARFGGGLNSAADAWSKIAVELPVADRQGGGDSSCSAAVDFTLQSRQEKTVRFLLAWYAPVWEGGHKKHVAWTNRRQHNEQVVSMERRPWSGSGDTNYYTEMYAARYEDAVDIARRMAVEHASLSQRVLAWQDLIYAETTIPVWLRDALVNNLCLIAEDSHWAQAKPPLGDWCYPEGAFGLNESPRGCPQMACIPCDWYGNLPIVFFFPQLALSTLRLFKHHQMEDGEVPISIGKHGDLPDYVTPSYSHQVSLNGFCYVDLVGRLWRRSGDDGILREFYESAKKCYSFTINLCRGPAGVISMPEAGGMEWFEMGQWAGMASHMGGLRLAGLRIMENMAEAMADTEYAEQCRTWFADGSRAMEDQMWTGSYYLNFYEKETGKKSDDVMGYQLDGQWAAEFHGLPGPFRANRVKTTLETIKRCNIGLTPDMGAVSFAQSDGSPLPAESKVAAYGQYAIFPPELLVLAMTYMYAGEKEFGLDLARRQWENLVLKQRHPWDLPNLIDGDTGRRNIGTDYYQNMMLWALPAALEGQDLSGPCRPGGLVSRILEAGKGEPHHDTDR